MILPFYEIAFDCTDPYRVAAFWRDALEYVQQIPTDDELEAAWLAHPEWRDIAIVEDELVRHPRLYLQRVPEPKIGRNRITFEVALQGPDLRDEEERLLALGAMRLDDDGWFADVEGNEFQIRPDPDGTRRFGVVVVDALDPARLAEFWGETFGFVVGSDRCDPPPDSMRSERGELIVNGQGLGFAVPAAARPPDGPVYSLTPGLKFRRTSERKVRKNRIHFDLLPTAVLDDRAAAFARGATSEDLAGTGHRGMFDPEGNEFCLHTDEMFD